RQYKLPPSLRGGWGGAVLMVILCALLLFQTSCKTGKSTTKTKQPGKPETAKTTPTVPETEEQKMQRLLNTLSFADTAVVQKVQILLYLHGYKPGKTDGIMKPQTEEALTAFQSNKQLPTTDRTALTLGTLGVQWLSFEVKDLQEALEKKGYDPGPIDNIIGPMTRTAYLAFLHNNELNGNNIINAQITEALFSPNPKYLYQPPPEETQLNAEADQTDLVAITYRFETQLTISQATVRDVQQALNAKGYDAGPYTTTPTPPFTDALQLYQSDHQLPQGGLNEETLRSLGFKDD
ncbi:MAG TPA: peptidoglycan-binding domain-containing protein, partial [Chitinophagales bacterium]|nr:peptidoglycan-binding domain-containing protein [Chitinophagales bacterium]